MPDQETEYEIGVEENNFLRTVVLEFIVIQLLQIVSEKIDDSERLAWFDKMKLQAIKFDDVMNSQTDPQKIAWSKRMKREFETIYNFQLLRDVEELYKK